MRRYTLTPSPFPTGAGEGRCWVDRRSITQAVRSSALILPRASADGVQGDKDAVMPTPSLLLLGGSYVRKVMECGSETTAFHSRIVL